MWVSGVTHSGILNLFFFPGADAVVYRGYQDSRPTPLVGCEGRLDQAPQTPSVTVGPPCGDLYVICGRFLFYRSSESIIRAGIRWRMPKGVPPTISKFSTPL